MPDDDAKDTKTDDLEDAPKPAEKPRAIATTDKAKSSAASSATPAKAKTKAKPVIEEDEDEEDDEEWEDEDEEDEEEPPPPPKKSVKSKALAKGKTAPMKGKPAVAARVVKRPVVEPVLHLVDRLPAKHYVPYAIGGLALIALHVWKDFDYQPVAVAGIALSIWAYLGIGSANEIKVVG